MTAQSKIEAPPNGLAKLREPFPEHQISKLPKETRAQIDARKADKNLMVWKCEVCGGAHHKNAVHLDYVGHAALTDRLLDTDITWSWEPVAFNTEGLPAFDRNGGLWINLTVCGMSRLGYGHAGDKSGGDAVKEVIGDALRNAAMRFGAALDLWHKGDLHIDGDNDADAATHEVAQKSEEEIPKAKRENWGGRYPNKTALRRARTVQHAELERIALEGTFDDLDGLLTSPEYEDYIKQAGEHFPFWLEGEIPPEAAEHIPPEYIQTFKLETKARDMIALRGNVPAEREAA